MSNLASRKLFSMIPNSRNVAIVLCVLLLTSKSTSLPLKSNVNQSASDSKTASDQSPLIQLKVLTFNTWNQGANVDDGENKIVQHIRTVGADIVFLQVFGLFNYKIFRGLSKFPSFRTIGN